MINLRTTSPHKSIRLAALHVLLESYNLEAIYDRYRSVTRFVVRVHDLRRATARIGRVLCGCLGAEGLCRQAAKFVRRGPAVDVCCAHDCAEVCHRGGGV